ncbi:fatty acid desaturase [Microbulbifer sp. TRSA005]|uniref:fatty acid desaturase n=1 Tax=unclassified Microbulbifer TaxID=2619833 RepID=UPI00403A3F3D
MGQHRHSLLIAASMNFAFGLILGLITGGIVAMFLLAGVLRMVINHHAAFAFNSLGPPLEQKKVQGDISARDNPVIHTFAFGEGYQNSHHAFPKDYRNGVGWFAYDPTRLKG